MRFETGSGISNSRNSEALRGALGSSLLERYQRTRTRTLELTDGLSAEDMMLQSMPDASPTKWHLAHTTWFFERLLLQKHCAHYRPFNDAFDYLFNSYYEALGQRHPRPQRGVLSRPSLREVLAYRQYVDEAMADWLHKAPSQSLAENNHNVEHTLVLGLHHEMQHQELMLTDIKHALSCNSYGMPDHTDAVNGSADTHNLDIHKGQTYSEFSGGIAWVGAGDDVSFAYDCERPRHQVLIHPFGLGKRLVTNGEWLAFMLDGGYRRAELWLSDGWHCCQREGWQMPLYWRDEKDGWKYLTLQGVEPLREEVPVCHISYYEADAFARWANARLPTEFEWEYAAQGYGKSGDHAGAQTNELDGDFAEASRWQPQVAEMSHGLTQLYGDVWEWTQSSFSPYPGYRPEEGALAEYNGKFMANQYVLRGGSCATPQQQIRPSYRNFFYPHQRWQFSGLRLAKSL